MTQVSVAELRRHLPSWLDRVARGEDVVVTRRGRPVAHLHAADDPRARARRFFDELRGQVVFADVVSPTGEEWDADAADEAGT